MNFLTVPAKRPVYTLFRLVRDARRTELFLSSLSTRKRIGAIARGMMDSATVRRNRSQERDSESHKHSIL